MAVEGMNPWGAGASVVGSGLNFLGGMLASDASSAMNAANISAGREMAQFNAGQSARAQEQAEAFNARQAEIARDFTGQWNEKGQEFAREMAGFNAQQAQYQRDWQERMSNTAYQRQMADMKAAGLNPILAAGSASGAVTPSGATGYGSGTGAAGAGGASVSPHSGSGSPGRASENPGAAMQRGIAAAVSTAMEAYKLSSEIDLIDQKEDSEKETKHRTRAERAYIQQQTQNAKIEEGIKNAHAVSAGARAIIDKREAEDTLRYGSKAVPGTLERIPRIIQDRLEEIPPPFGKRDGAFNRTEE